MRSASSLCRRKRRSIHSAAAESTRITRLAAAAAKACDTGSTVNCDISMEESGKIDTAAMAMKCRLQIASVSRMAAAMVACMDGRRNTTSSASAARVTPVSSETATSSVFQTMRPSTSKAAMPI